MSTTNTFEIPSFKGGKWKTVRVDTDKRAENEFPEVNHAVTDTEDRLKEAVRIAKIGHWVFDEVNEKLTYCSKEYARIYGYTREELLANIDSTTADVELAHPDDRQCLAKLYRETVAQGKSYEIVHRIVRKGGTVRYVRELGNPIFDDDGRCIQTFGISMDITELKQTEEKLRKAYDDLELRIEERTRELSREITERKFAEETLLQANLELESRVEKRTRSLKKAKDEAELANYAKTQFLANMSHELRTPLNGIIGFSEMILSEAFGSLGDKYREYAEDILGSGQHLLSVVKDILDISRLEKGTLDLDEGRVDLYRLAVPCMKLTRQKATERQVALSLEIPEDIPPLLADETRLKQILINLLSNAVKFTPAKGQVIVDAHLDGDDALVLQVTDTGCGIAAEDIPKVFEPFAQVEDVMTRSHEGSGIGLSISKRLAELHGGTLSIESEVGKGTTVTVGFPSERTIRPS